MTLKDKTVNGLLWSFIDSFAGQSISIIVGIILARLLSPKEFGLIGMITIFIAVSQSFIDSGFHQTLIRKQNCTQADYSTVFFFNIAVGVFFYLILFYFSEPISVFYKEPELCNLIRVLGLGLIINSLTIIQSTILTKKINFKLQAKISIIAYCISGIISIYLAYTGWGVWSLVALTLLRFAINTALLWLWNKWKPILIFSISSFKEMFSFGSKLLISGLIETLYRNIYYLVIGKYFSATELGYYTRADQFQNIPSANLQYIIGRVSYPVLSSLQDSPEELKASYKKIIRSTMLVTFILMLGMVAVARSMIFTLIGAKWEPCIIYLQLLCFSGMLFPLHALNLNMLNVKGRSDLYLKIEIIKKIIAVPIIIIGVIYGIKVMILGMLATSVIAYFLNSFYSGRLIGYSTFEQIKDIFPSFIFAFLISFAVYFESRVITFSPLVMFVLQVTTFALIALCVFEITRFKDYMYIKQIVKEKIQVIKNNRSL